MNSLQYSVIAVLAAWAALSVMLFDKRGRAHKPISAFIAYVTFVQMVALAFAAYMRSQVLTEWLLISGLAVYVGGILFAGGNVAKVFNRKVKE